MKEAKNEMSPFSVILCHPVTPPSQMVIPTQKFTLTVRDAISLAAIASREASRYWKKSAMGSRVEAPPSPEVFSPSASAMVRRMLAASSVLL